MKRAVTRAALAIAAVLIAAIGVAQQPVQVQVNGQYVAFPDTPAQTVNGRTLIPVRAVFEQMGGDVGWDPTTQTVTVNLPSGDVIMHIGDYNATVLGNSITLDTAPEIIENRTMVPAQFFNQGLDANVSWDANASLVTIDTMNSTIISTPAQALHRFALRQWMIVPASLDSSLSSTYSHVGDTFHATVLTGDSATLPSGTQIEGHVAAVQGMTSENPGVLDLAFDQIVLPDGTKMAIDGSLLSLDTQYATLDATGLYKAQNDAITIPRMVFVGYGSSIGMLLTAKDDRALNSETLLDSLDYLQSQVPSDQTQQMDVTLPTGTQIGVRLNKDVSPE